MVASASEDTTIKLWDYEMAHYERTLKGHTGSVTALAFSPAGDMLASASADMSAKIWDMSTFACIKTLRGHDHSVSSVAFGTDVLFTCSRDSTLKCWEVSSGYCTKTFTGHTDWVRCLSLSTDGDIIVSGSSDNSVIVWKTNNGKILQVWCILCIYIQCPANVKLFRTCAGTNMWWSLLVLAVAPRVPRY